MLQLNKIFLTQFKNYSSASFEFTKRIVGICGVNGLGKTNLLDAIYYLCFTKSYFSKSDILNVQFNAEGFRLEGKVNDEKIVCIYRNPAKKEFYVNDCPYEKFSMHIGKFPCVMVAPDDIEMIAGGSELRRKYIDTILSQIDADYLQHLITYNKLLQQRNSLLKNLFEGNMDMQLLQVLNEQLVHPGNKIFIKRKLFLKELIPLVKQFYHHIADADEEIDVFYDSQLNQSSFEALLEKNLHKDIAIQRSSAGIHKDDLRADLRRMPFKNIASQGQKKSLLFALKLAEFQILKQNKGFAPLLLLDDVFEKLDDIRMQNLLKWVCTNNDGQVFITDTHLDRLKKYLEKFYPASQIVELN